MNQNEKKSVFITGGTSGIGQGLIKKFLADHYVVGICSFEKIEMVKTWLPAEVVYFEADVRDTEKMKNVIDDFFKKTGRLDIVVACAGINHPKAKIPDFAFGTKVIEVNVNGVLNTFGPAIEIMKNQGHGQLAAISSIAGVIGGMPGMAIYCASKAAVLSLCESLAIDLKGFNIKVTTLAPGFIDTPLTKNNDHAMPFLMSEEYAVNEIYSAIQKNKGLYLFPIPLKIMAILMRLIPRSLYKLIMQKDLLRTGNH